ncbi:MAG: nitroreductase family protein, partial [Gammaproteobacteria bacterium]|nr:nitroreductase family protein [Gammaproteobacteria bacterium]
MEFKDNPGFFDLVGNVRAMRRLKPDPVPEAMLRKVLDAGVMAPSGQNKQPWSFLVIQDAVGREWFAERYRAAIESRFGAVRVPEGGSSLAREFKALRYQIDHMHEVPLLLVVCGLRDWPFRVPPEERNGLAPPNYGAIYHCVQNILLACRAVGLGAALTTMHQVFEEEMQARFGIPDEYGIVVTLPVGFPMGRFGPVRR